MNKRIVAIVLGGTLALCTLVGGQQSDEREERELARGVRYFHLVRSTSTSEPWSIHVVEMSRKEKQVALRSVRAAGAEGEMQRELPSAMAKRAAEGGLNVLAVVNGDYDLPSPHLGISDGLCVTAGAVTTTGKPTWPAMGLTSSGVPLIGVPQVEIALSSRGGTTKIAALNKPLSTTWGTGPYLYTREFRSTVKSEKPFRAMVIGKLSRALPLRVDSTVNGVVEEILEGATQVPIATGKLVLVAALDANGSGSTVTLHAGDKVKLRIRVRIGGQKIRDVVAGFPILVQHGRKNIVGRPSERLSQRHPRTAFCYNPERIIFAVVDGRQPKLSVGMTLDELADLMVELGCTTAMNSDGGGSSVMAVLEDTKGAQQAAPLRIVNSPSDGQERGRGNAWIIVKK